ncbi:MAG: DUF1874 domain-containing protein [Metallosphaera sp.]
MKYLSNAFSLSMLTGKETDLHVSEISRETFCTEISGSESAIGHAGTAAALSTVCNKQIPFNRITLKLQPGDVLYVAQIMFRLAEGQILSFEELMGYISSGMLKFYKVQVM